MRVRRHVYLKLKLYELQVLYHLCTPALVARQLSQILLSDAETAKPHLIDGHFQVFKTHTCVGCSCTR